ELDGDGLLDDGVARLEDYAHPALAELLLQVVPSVEDLADQPVVFARRRSRVRRHAHGRGLVRREHRRRRPELRPIVRAEVVLVTELRLALRADLHRVVIVSPTHRPRGSGVLATTLK